MLDSIHLAHRIAVIIAYNCCSHEGTVYVFNSLVTLVVVCLFDKEKTWWCTYITTSVLPVQRFFRMQISNITGFDDIQSFISSFWHRHRLLGIYLSSLPTVVGYLNCWPTTLHVYSRSQFFASASDAVNFDQFAIVSNSILSMDTGNAAWVF